MTWLWLNMSLGALFVLAISGIPLWLVITRPDTGPKPAELAAWRRWSAAIGRELHHHQHAPARPRPAHQHADRLRLDPAAEG